MNATGMDIIRQPINLSRKRLYEARLRELERSVAQEGTGKRPSRPAVPSRALWFRMREDDKVLLIRAAEAAGAGSLSGWAKSVLLDTARQVLNPARVVGGSAKPGV